jgi:hypothetical protein
MLSVAAEFAQEDFDSANLVCGIIVRLPDLARLARIDHVQ